jgi:hypothetical protein
MRASRRATITKQLSLSSGGLAHKGARRSMASDGGVDPAEAESKLFAVTDSLIDAGLAPSIHVGRGISVSASTRTTVRAEIETEEGEETFVFELPKAELWRAVVLIDEYGRGPGVPSAAVSRDSAKHRRKIADMFLTNDFDQAGRSSTSSSGVTVTRVSASSLSPAAALTALAALSGTPATNDSRSDVVAGASDSSPGPRSVLKKAPTPTARAAARGVEAGEGPSVTEQDPSSEAERMRDRQYTLAQKAARELVAVHAHLEVVHRKWRDLSRCMARAVAISRTRVVSGGGRVRYVEMLPTVAPAPAPRAPVQSARMPGAAHSCSRQGVDLAACMAQEVAGRGRAARAPPSAAEVIEILEELSGDSDDEEDGAGVDDNLSSDGSVKPEQFDDEQTADLLRELRAASGGGTAPDVRDAARPSQEDDPVSLLDAFLPRQLTEKATLTVVKFLIGHVRETLEATGARLAPAVERADVRKEMQHAGMLIVRLAGYVNQSPGELVGAAVVRAATPRPCRTTVQGATALRALREIVLEHSTVRNGAQGAVQGDVDQGSRRRSVSLSASGALRQQLGVPSTRFQMFHMGDGGMPDKAGSEVLGQNIFERGLRTITNDPAARAQLVKVYELLEEGLSEPASGDDPFVANPGCLFVRTVAGMVGTAHASGSGAASHTSTMWAHVFLAEQSGKPSASTRERMVHDEGYEYLDTVWQTVCSVRAGIEQVLQQEWRRLMRRESLDARVRLLVWAVAQVRPEEGHHGRADVELAGGRQG